MQENNTARLVSNSQQRNYPDISDETFGKLAAEKLHENFYLACERDLRASVARLRLYLEDDRTVGVLVGHITDRIVDEYVTFRELIWDMYGGALREVLFNTSTLRGNLREICDEGPQGSAST